MVDTSLKNQNQPSNTQAQKNSSLDKALTPADSSVKNANSPLAQTETRQILNTQRQAANVATNQGLAFNALFKTGTATETSQKSAVKNSPSSLRSKSAGRSDRDRRTQNRSAVGSGATEELREQMSIRAAVSGQRASAAAASNRGTSTGTNNGVASAPIDGMEAEAAGLQHNLVGQDSLGEAAATSKRFETTTNNEGKISSAQSLDGIALNTSTETLKLLDVVGPEAILSFREKLQQVWVTLDDNATRQLDVIARMPATMTGSTAIELLMVESPQGIHFVAFLKNKNDFEVLATFDRRALLPESPSRQLIEAGLIAYEQLDSVFKEGGQKIEQMARALAEARGTNDMVFHEVQKMMVQEKRRRRKFRQMMDYFIDKLDEIDLEGDPNEAPFAPNNLESKDKDLEASQEESPIDLDIMDLDNEPEERGFRLKPEDTEDADYH